MTAPAAGASSVHMIVLPGGGYAEHAVHEAEPIADWLGQIGVPASVFRYPLHTRHPVPLEALRAEISRRRANGAQRIGLIGFSAGGHLASLAALAPGATPDQAVQFAVLGYAITSMETETYRPARLILLGEDAARSCAGQPRWTRWSRPAHHRSSSGTPRRTPTSRPNTPTASPRHSRPAASRTPCTCSPTGRTASAWPAAPARPSLDRAGGSLDPRTGVTTQGCRQIGPSSVKTRRQADLPGRFLHGRDYPGPRLLRPA